MLLLCAEKYYASWRFWRKGLNNMQMPSKKTNPDRIDHERKVTAFKFIIFYIRNLQLHSCTFSNFNWPCSLALLIMYYKNVAFKAKLFRHSLKYLFNFMFCTKHWNFSILTHKSSKYTYFAKSIIQYVDRTLGTTNTYVHTLSSGGEVRWAAIMAHAKELPVFLKKYLFTCNVINKYQST